MTMNYKILWIDDTPDWVAPVRQALEDEMLELKLSPTIFARPDGKDMEDILGGDSIDLIIVDQGLPDRKGEELIRSVREHGETTEIVFYSQDDQVGNPVNTWAGVKFTKRDDAEGAIKETMKAFVDRATNMSVMRGVIIAEAIDVENKLTDIIKKLFGEKAALFQEKILGKAYLDFAKKCDFVQSCLNDVVASARIEQPQNATRLAKLEACCDTLKTMKKEIVEQRNILAHSDKETDANGNLVLKGLNKSTPNIIFDNAWRNSIRDNISKHKKNLSELNKLIDIKCTQ